MHTYIRLILFVKRQTIHGSDLSTEFLTMTMGGGGESKIKGGGPHHFPSLDSQASHAAPPVVPAVLLPIVIGVFPLCPKGPDRCITKNPP